MRVHRWLALSATLVLAALGSAGVASAQCGPMDVVFIIDNSGSMQPVIDEVKGQVAKIADAVQAASGGDYQFGLITMPANNVVVALDMTAKNRTALDAAVLTMATVGSTGAGIAYDEALDVPERGVVLCDALDDGPVADDRHPRIAMSARSTLGRRTRPWGST